MLALCTYEPSSIGIRNCLGGRLKEGVQSQTAQGSVTVACCHTPHCLYCCFRQVCCSRAEWVILVHIFIFSNGCILFLKFLLLHLFIGWGMCGRSKGRL